MIVIFNILTQINTMADSYQTVVQVSTCYGNFSWHGSQPAGVFLSEGTPGEEKGAWMLNVTVDINEKLMNACLHCISYRARFAAHR
jgi:hypothetical protein